MQTSSEQVLFALLGPSSLQVWKRLLATCNLILSQTFSAVHRSRRAGAGVLTNFAGAVAGAGVCSPPAKLRQHLFVLQTSIIDQRKN